VVGTDEEPLSVDLPHADEPTSAYGVWFADGSDPWMHSDYAGDHLVSVDRRDAAKAQVTYGGPTMPMAQELWEDHNFPAHSGLIVNGWWRIIWGVLGGRRRHGRVSGQLLTVVAAYCALVAALALLAAGGVRCVPALRAGLVVAELLLVVQALAGAVSLLRGHRPQDPATTHLGYLAVSVVLVPLLLGLPGRRPPDRPARADHLVAAVAAGAALVVSVRLHTTWRA
jgi:hypothetical protein